MNVFIVNTFFGYTEMFRDNDWTVVDSIHSADLVQFTGGEDVSPSLYNRKPHPQTYSNPMRDKKEKVIFDLCLSKGKKMAGICRGAQFLNVMCGGELWQHVDGHCNGAHVARDTKTGESFYVSSTHHQMMIPGTDGEVIVESSCSSFRERVIRDKVVKVEDESPTDVEAAFYPKHGVFCFQPHPEMGGFASLGLRYIEYLEKYLFGKGE